MSDALPETAIDVPDIQEASGRIREYVRKTPIIRLDGAEFGLAHPLVLKLELLQHTGSFKPRGAFARLTAAAVPAAGVIAASGGNHGAAVAYAAQVLGVPAEIFVPETAPAAKRALIAGYGAKLLLAGGSYAEAFAAAQARRAETGALDVHAYDDPDVLAGQGTVAMELEADAPGLTHIVVAVGGGGLVGGIAAWYRGRADVIAVEPEACPALSHALAAGRPVPAPASGVAADSLGARQVGALMFPIARAFVGRSVLVPDHAIERARALLWDKLRLVAEPGGATALAALTSGAVVPPPGARVGVIVCGGNATPAGASDITILS